MKSVEAISEAFNIYSHNFVKLFIGAAVFGFAIQLASFILINLPNRILAIVFTFIPSLIGLIALGLVAVVISIIGSAIHTLISGMFTGGFIYYCHGVRNKSNPSPSLVVNPPRKISLIIAPLIAAIPSFIVLGLASAVFLVFAGISLQPLLSGNISSLETLMPSLLASLLIAVVVFFIAAVIVFIINFFLSFTLLSVVLDGKGAIDGAKTSVSFVLHNIIEVIVFFILLLIISVALAFVVLLILGIPLLIIGFLTALINLIPFVGPIISDLIQVVISSIAIAFIAPFGTLCMVIFYLSLSRKPSVPTEPTPVTPS